MKSFYENSKFSNKNILALMNLNYITQNPNWIETKYQLQPPQWKNI